MQHYYFVNTFRKQRLLVWTLKARWVACGSGSTGTTNGPSNGSGPVQHYCTFMDGGTSGRRLWQYVSRRLTLVRYLRCISLFMM